MWNYFFKRASLSYPMAPPPLFFFSPLALCQAGNPSKQRADRQIKLLAIVQTEQTVTKPVPEHKDNDVMHSPLWQRWHFAVREQCGKASPL